MRRNSFKEIGKNAGFRFGGVIIQNILFLLTALTITKMLDSSALGDYFLVVTMLNILGFASTLGMKFGTVRYVALYRRRGDPEGVKGTIVSSAVISLGVGIGAGVILFFLSPLIADRIFRLPGLRVPLRIMAGALPFLSLGTVLISALQGLKEIGSKVWLENIIQPLAALVLIGVTLVIFHSFPAVSAAWSVSMVMICAAAGIFLAGKLRGSLNRIRPRYEIGELLSFSLPLMAVGFLYYLFTRMDILMIGYFKSSGDVGVYAIAARLAFLIALPLEALNSIFEPTIAEESGSGRENQLAHLYRRVTPLVLAIGFAIFVILVILTTPLMSLFGGNFTEARLVLIILGLGQLVNLGVGSSGALLSMSGHPKFNLLNTVSIVVLNFILNCFLIPPYGIYGAAAATAVSIGSINILRLIEVKRLLGLHPFSVKYFRILIAVFLGGLTIFLSEKYIAIGGGAISRALIQGGLFFAVYIPLLALIGLDAGDRKIFNKGFISRLISRSS